MNPPHTPVSKAQARAKSAGDARRAFGGGAADAEALIHPAMRRNDLLDSSHRAKVRGAALRDNAERARVLKASGNRALRKNWVEGDS